MLYREGSRFGAANLWNLFVLTPIKGGETEIAIVLNTAKDLLGQWLGGGGMKRRPIHHRQCPAFPVHLRGIM